MRKLVVLSTLIAVISAATAACAETEEPRYSVIEKASDIEIRHYGPRLAAEVLVQGEEERARSEGFRLLADYIFGNNTAGHSVAMTAPVAQQAARSEKIAMTAPVAQVRGDGGSWRVRFFMPMAFTRETLPRPNNPAVRIVELPGETMAVLRFSNSRSALRVAAKTAELLGGLENTRWAAAGAPVAWFYDPPWTLPFFRRNEVAVPVRAR